MSFDDLLPDTCNIQVRTVDTSGMTTTESWSDGEDVPCRILKNSASLFNAEKAQHATIIRTRFVLRASESIAIRGRIKHEERYYEVVEVVAPFKGSSAHHKVVICETIAGEV